MSQSRLIIQFETRAVHFLLLHNFRVLWSSPHPLSSFLALPGRTRIGKHIEKVVGNERVAVFRVVQSSSAAVWSCHLGSGASLINGFRLIVICCGELNHCDPRTKEHTALVHWTIIRLIHLPLWSRGCVDERMFINN